LQDPCDTAVIWSRHGAALRHPAEQSGSPAPSGIQPQDGAFHLLILGIEFESMTGEQSRRLLVGDRVCWCVDNKDLGSVAAKNWSGVTLKWDNRSVQFVLHNDMAQVSIVGKSKSR
jgi:hypothetical protein